MQKRKSKHDASTPYPGKGPRIVRRARELGFTVTFPDPGLPRLFTVAKGRKRAVFLSYSMPLNSAMAANVANDKRTTRALLAAQGLPIPRGEAATTTQAAEAFRRRIGGPVVVKPVAGKRAIGVSTNIRSLAALRRAVQKLRLPRGAAFLVEEHVRGPEVRVTVLDGRVLAASRYDALEIVGDGVRSVMELIEGANAERGRGEEDVRRDRRVLFRDGHVLASLKQQKLTLESVPPAGARVRLRISTLICRDGLVVDITDELHPRIAALAIRATAALGLRIGGVDLMGDVLRAPRPGSVYVNEVNANPDLLLHDVPDIGTKRDLYREVLRALFPSR